MNQPTGPLPPQPPRAGTFAPPTAPGRIDAASFQPSWPMILGIFCLVYGVLVSLAAFFGLLSPVFMNLVAQLIPAEEVAASGMKPTPTIVILNTAYYAPALILNLVLCVLGYQLTKRRHATPGRLTLWAWLKVLIELIGSGTTFFATMISFRNQMQAQSTLTPAEVPAFMQSNTFVYGTAAGGALWSLVIGLALPIFLLIWFRRARVVEYVGTWPKPDAYAAR